MYVWWWDSVLTRWWHRFSIKGSRRKSRVEKKDNKFICGCVKMGAFVGLPGDGSVSRKQTESGLDLRSET